MSKGNITSYFQVISRTKGGESSTVSNSNKNKFLSSDDDEKKSSLAKRRKLIAKRKKILSDSEDEVLVIQEPKKRKLTNGDKTERKRGSSRSKTPKKQPEPTKQSDEPQVISDSDDEVINKSKSKKIRLSNKDKVESKKTVAVADVFGSKPVKRTEVPNPPKKLRTEDAGFDCDDELAAVLDQVENSGDNHTGKTIGKVNGDVNREKNDPKKENDSLHKLSKSDNSPDDKIKRVIGTGHGQKVSKDERNGSKLPQKTTPEKKKMRRTKNISKNSRASGSSKTTGSDSVYQNGISDITIDKTPDRKRKWSNEDEEADPYEVLAKQKKHSAALFQQYLQRGGARNPGSKEIPTGADNCLSGLSFLITGVLDSMEREEADELIKQYGGRILVQVSKKTNYVILGDVPGPAKLAKAKQLGVKTISEDDLLEMIRTRPAGQVNTDIKHPIGKPKKPHLKAKQKTPEPEPLTSTKPDPSLEAKNGCKVNLEVFDKKPKALLSEKTDTVETKKVSKTTDIPPVIRVPGEIGSQVWVEKYRPKNMKQIIGQQGDKSNAHKLYTWLKNWQKNQSGTVKLTRPSPWAQSDGAFFKAALLSGPPGVGKTTTVQVVCDALRLDALEFNASDTRSKRLLKEEVSELLNNKSMKGYFVGGDSKKPGINHVLVMDEVDGMAGNEDRGGLQELITLIKTTNVPVICICNDRNNPKMRTLSNYTFDLKFQKPRMEQIKSAMMSVCFKENIKIPPEDLTRLIESTNNDVRQVLNHLSLLAGNPSVEETSKGRRCTKDLRLGPWEVVQKVFTHDAHKTMSIHDKSDLFFHDYNIAPLFVQENYLSVIPNCPKNKLLETIADSAESLALGDLVENAIRRSGAWTLLPMQACYSSVIPGTLMSGHIARQIMFPSWLGQNSKRGKFDRLIQEITIHARLATSSSKDAINLDYLKHLRDAVVRPLVTQGTQGATLALDAMNHYHLLREDLDSLAEVSLWSGQRDPMQALDSKVKAAFTRAFNKSSIMRPYALTKGAEKKKRAKGTNEEDLLDFEGEEYESEEDDENLSSDPMIKQVKKAPAAGGKKTASTSEKETSGAKKKSSNPRAGKSKAKK